MKRKRVGQGSIATTGAYWATVQPTEDYIENDTPLDQAIRAKQVLVLSVATGGHHNGLTWVKVWSPKGSLPKGLKSWGEWQRVSLEAQPPVLTVDDEPWHVQALANVEAAMESFSGALQWGLDFGSGAVVAFLVLLVLMKRK